MAQPQADPQTVTSQAYRSGVIDFGDLDWRTRPYSRQKAYGDSKLANLLFTQELQRRLERAGATALSLATDPAARKLDFYGPRFGLRGPPRRIRVRGDATSAALARLLWKVTGKITGFRYDART